MTSSKSKYLVTAIAFITDIIVRTMPALAEETALPEIGGLLMLDYSQHDGIYISTHGDEDVFYIRRARVSLNHEYGDDWKFELDIKFDEETNSTRTLDAFIQYEGVEFMDFTVGQMKEPFGLEKLTASKNGTFLERSTITGATAPGRNKGIMLSSSPGDLTWAFGLFDIDAKEVGRNPHAATGRVTWAPVDSESRTVHIGVAGSWRDLDRDAFEIKESGEVYAAENFINTSEIESTTVRLTGLEAAVAFGPLSFQAEYSIADIEAVDPMEDAIIDGYYVQTSYFLTGESRRYRNGHFRRVNPNEGRGAWELIARYSVLDTLQMSNGDRGETATLGVNYYHGDHIRVMLNLMQSTIDNEDDGTAASLRVQYAF